MPIQCRKCHAVNRDSAQFCDNCGASLTDFLPSANTVESSQKTRPDTLPEIPTGTPNQTFPNQTTIHPPNVHRGPTFFSWLVFLILVVGISFGLFAFLTSRLDYGDSFTEFLVVVFVVFFIGLLIFLNISRSKVYIGLVTHVEPWTQQISLAIKKSTPNLVFNLQRTDRQWNVIKDQQGFLKPVLEVAFRTNKVHGSPIEESARVMVKGKKSGDRIIAKEIWNMSSKGLPSSPIGETKYWGRVMNKMPPRSMQDLRYPGQGKVLEIWEFRLQPTDPSFERLARNAQSDLLAPIPVEIRAMSISGPLQDNDKVLITGQMVNGTLYVHQLVNHSAGKATLVVKEIAGIP